MLITVVSLASRLLVTSGSLGTVLAYPDPLLTSLPGWLKKSSGQLLRNWMSISYFTTSRDLKDIPSRYYLCARSHPPRMSELFDWFLLPRSRCCTLTSPRKKLPAASHQSHFLVLDNLTNFPLCTWYLRIETDNLCGSRPMQYYLQPAAG